MDVKNNCKPKKIFFHNTIYLKKNYFSLIVLDNVYMYNIEVY